MGQVTVIFQGIVTHFRDVAIAPGLTVHRAVLINASGENVINGIRIPPHIANVSVANGLDIIVPETQMQGVELTLSGGLPLSAPPSECTIVNPGAAIQYCALYDEIIPSLQNQMSGVQTLSDPDPTLLFDKPWPAVAAYVNVTSGTFSACNHQGAAVARLTIEIGDEDVVGLAVSAFPNAPDLPANLVGPFQLTSGATISITNLAPMLSERETNPRSHFFLHYLLAQNYPAAPQAPIAIGTQAVCGLDATVDAGCSDSNYP